MTGDTFTTLSFNVQRNLCFAVMVHGSPQCQWEEKNIFLHVGTRKTNAASLQVNTPG